ncbi:NB-ARC domain-containing protein [Micromonospora sp. WMMD812]|uniref:NB-ARC domain-containing protein n=1 Tax=Micromonospora sp. WMMD812 TaxID=3015152 RepID=UPI00248AEE40|nr:NB-ARC domain-containing protein [Micromonospora sp. WMMD812]WBB69282.1 NB-ARC domain-containing protein [Micromonospora sp. WMMD812]
MRRGGSGGAATNAGIDFQQRVAASIMAFMVSDQPDLTMLGEMWHGCSVTSLRFETGDLIDDLVVVTDGPTAYIQAKRTLSLSDAPASDYSSVLAQFVGQFLASANSDGERYVIATTHDASSKIRTTLRKLVKAARSNADGYAANPLTKVETEVQRTTEMLLNRHCQAQTGRPLTNDERVRFWRLMDVTVLDVTAGGVSEAAAIAALGPGGRHAWSTLVALGLELATERLSIDRATIRRRAVIKPSARGQPLPWDTPHLGALVARDGLAAELRDALLSTEPFGITMVTGVHGAGGFGKSTLVAQVCRMPEIRARYGGHLWTTVGADVHGPALASQLNDLTERLTGTRPGLSDPQQAGFLLGRAIEDSPGKILLVVDDVWQSTQLAPFLTGPANCTTIVTTRNAALLADASSVVLVDRMSDAEAADVLTHGITDAPTAAVDALCTVTGHWPVLLSIANRILRRMIRSGMNSASAIALLTDRLRRDGPAALDIASSGSRAEAVAVTVEVGLDQVPPGTRARYLELAVFAEDSEIPLDLLEHYWRETSGLDRAAVEQACIAMADLSLVTDLRFDQRTLRLHDVLRAYLRQRVGTEGIRTSNAHFLAGVGRDGPWWEMAEKHRYLSEHLIEHLPADDAARLVEDLRWTRAQIATRGTAAIEADLTRVNSPVAARLAAAIRQHAHLFERVEPAASLGAVLVTRLAGTPGLDKTVDEFRPHLTGPQLTNRWPLPDPPHPAARRVIGGYVDGIRRLAISPDGKWFASLAGYDTVTVRDAVTTATVATFHNEAFCMIDEVLPCHDGARLITTETAGADRGRVRIWEAHTGTLQYTFDTAFVLYHSERVQGAVSLDDRWLALVDYDPDQERTVVRIWCLATGELLRTLADADAWPQTVAFSPDGGWLVAGDDASADDEPCEVQIWNTADGRCIRRVAGPIGGVDQVTVAPDGSWFGAVDRARTVWLWNTDGTLRHTFPTSMIWPTITVAADGTWLTCHDYTGSVLVWDVVSGTERFQLAGQADLAQLAVAPNGSWLAITADGPDGSMVRIHDTRDGRLRDQLQGHSSSVGALTVAPDGTWLVTGDRASDVRQDSDMTVRIWATEWRDHTVPAMVYPAFDLLPDGTEVAFVAAEGPRLASLDTGVSRPVIGPAKATTLVAGPSWLAVSDGQRIEAVTLPDGNRRWTTRRCDGVLESVAAVSPDGAWLLTRESAAHVTSLPHLYAAFIRDAATGVARQVLRLDDYPFGAGATAVAPDGTFLAVTRSGRSRDKEFPVTLWDVRDGVVRHVLPGHREGVEAITIAPDSAWLVTGEALMNEHESCAARVWDARTGVLRLILPNHRGAVSDIAIANDGTWIVTGDEAGAVRIWDPDTGVLLRKFSGTAPVTAIAISPGNDWIAVADGAGGMGTVRIWSRIGEPLAAMRVDGPLTNCRWIPDRSGLCLSGSRGFYVFDWRP